MNALGNLLLIGFIEVTPAWYSWSTTIATMVGFVVCGLGIALAQSPLVVAPTSEMLPTGSVAVLGELHIQSVIPQDEAIPEVTDSPFY